MNAIFAFLSRAIPMILPKMKMVAELLIVGGQIIVRFYNVIVDVVTTIQNSRMQASQQA